MKVLLAAALAVSTLAGSVIAVQPAEAAVVKVVVRPGYHYYYGGRHYRYRAYRCVHRYHRKVCKYRYW